MTAVSSTVYKPQSSQVEIYAKLFRLYEQLHDSFGVKNTGINLYHIMKDLHTIRHEVSHAE